MKQFLLLVLLAGCAPAHAGEIPPAADLGADGRRARASGQPIVMLFTATYCEYCAAVKAGYFRHLDSDPRYASRIILREVIIDSANTLTDFTGNARSHARFAGANGVTLVPTARFVDGKGRELADPLVGVSNLDFYGWYLDQRIRRAMQRMAAEPARALDHG